MLGLFELGESRFLQKKRIFFQWIIIDLLSFVYIVPVGLPLSERNRDSMIQFIGASERVDIMDIAKVVVNDIKDLQM